MVTREDVVAEALTWRGTRYHHCADVKGHGVDCAMLLVRVFCDLGLSPAFDPRPYKPQWYLHRDQPIFLEWLQRYAHRVERADRGDVALYNFGRHAAHGAIIINDRALIHAYQPAGSVELEERAALENRLHSYWSCF